MGEEVWAEEEGGVMLERLRLSALVKDVEKGGDIDVVLAAEAEATIADLQGQLATAKAPRVYDCGSCAIGKGFEQRVAQLEGERDALRDSVQDMNYDLLACDEQYEALQADHARVLGLVQALCPSEGCTFTVSKERDEDDLYSVYVDINGQGYGSCAEFYSRQEALAYAAIRTYRASLPAQPAQGGVNEEAAIGDAEGVGR